MKNKWRRISKRIVPLILVCSLTIGLIFGTNTKEVKAVAGVDDIAIVIALLAMCGVTYYGSQQLMDKVSDGTYDLDNWDWGDLAPGEDGLPSDEEKEKARDWLGEHTWDNAVKERAKELGYIDEDGNIIEDKYPGGGSSGGSSGGNDDNNNKFPSWEKLKETISTNEGKLGLQLSFYLPLIAIFGQKVLEDSGAKLADKVLADDSINVDISYISADTRAIVHSEGLLSCGPDGIIVSSLPICFVDEQIYYFANHGTMLEFSNGVLVRKNSVGNCYGGVSSRIYEGYKIYSFSPKYTMKIMTRSPYFDTEQEALEYLVSHVNEKDYINPETVASSPSLDKNMKENDDKYPVVPIFNNVRIPTDEEFAQYLKDLKDSEDDDEKKKGVIDDFIKNLTSEQETPTPTPTPTPSPTPAPDSGETPTPSPSPGGDSSGGSDKDTGSDSGSDSEPENSKFTADLKTLFPFCIPFDIVDCIKLFNAEPETPRIEVPMHFGIVNKDYTWVIDLKDFDSVALIFRTMFLIVFLIGLAITTSKVIKW